MLGLSKVAEAFSTLRAARQGAGGQSHAPSRIKARQVLLRPVLDASMVFAALCLIGLTFGTAPSSASPNVPPSHSYQMTVSPMVLKALSEGDVQPVIEIATTNSPDSPDAVFRRTSAQAAWALLMIALSVVVALNLAMFRHMRQAYAPVRRRPTQD